MKIEWNKQGMKKLEKQIENKLDAASKKANAAASRHKTLDGQVNAYAREMKKAGAEIDKRELKKKLKP